MRALSSSLVDAIEQRLRMRRVRGLALVAFDRDGVRFGGGVGFADLERGERVGTDTVFRVASVSKQLTTTLGLRAVDDGLLDLDEPVNDRLPRAQHVLGPNGDPAPVTLRSLLNHTSGLPSSVRGIDLGHRLLTRLANDRPARTLTEAVTGLQTVRPIGDRIVYANSGLNLAGHLAALAYGTSFEAAAKAQVFDPLGMDRSAFSTRRSGPGVATPYGPIAPGVSVGSAAALQLYATPMGGLTTTVEDLARFGRMVLGGGVLDGVRLLDPALVADATTLGARNHPELEQGFGLGFKVRTWRGRRLVGHDGNMPGVATMLWMAPDDGVGVVVLTNGPALGIPHEVAQLALAELLGDDPRPVGGSPEPTPDADGPSAAEAEALADRVAGRYVIESVAPPGLVGTLARLTTKIVIRHEAAGLLRVDGNPAADGPMWLQPEGRLGHYRIAAAVDHGTDAVVEDGPDGVRIWAAHSTLLRRTSPR